MQDESSKVWICFTGFWCLRLLIHYREIHLWIKVWRWENTFYIFHGIFKFRDLVRHRLWSGKKALSDLRHFFLKPKTIIFLVFKRSAAGINNTDHLLVMNVTLHSRKKKRSCFQMEYMSLNIVPSVRTKSEKFTSEHLESWEVIFVAFGQSHSCLQFLVYVLS